MKLSNVIVIIALAGTVCACSSKEEKQLARQQTAHERITILEQAKNSTDPYVQQQAKLVREEIRAEEEKRRADKEKAERDKILNPVLGVLLLIALTVLMKQLYLIQKND